MPQISTPTKVSMTPELVTKMATRDKYTEGTYCWLASQAVRWGSDKGHKMIRVTWQALQDPEDIGSVHRLRVQEFLGLPLISDEIADHEPPSFWGESFNRWIKTVLGADDVLGLPQRVDGVLTFDGEEITVDEEQDKRNEAILSSCEKAIELWESDEMIESIKGCFVYADAVDEGGFTKLATMSTELLPGKTLVSPENFIAGMDEKPTGSTGRAKKNGKAAKRRSRK